MPLSNVSVRTGSGESYNKRINTLLTDFTVLSRDFPTSTKPVARSTSVTTHVFSQLAHGVAFVVAQFLACFDTLGPSLDHRLAL